MTPEASHAEMLGVLSRYITRPLRNDGKWDTVLQLLEDLTVAVLFMGDKLDDPAEARLEAMTQRIKLQLEIQLKRRAPEPVADPAFESWNFGPEQFIPGVDYRDTALTAHITAGGQWFVGARTAAGGGAALLKSHTTYRMRCGEIVTVQGIRALTQYSFTDGKRKWLPSGHFISTGQKDDRDLVQQIITEGISNA